MKHGSSTEVNQTSMNDRIEELYVEELEKDITKKISEKGYQVTKCKVNVQISNKEEETKINKIKLNINKKEDLEKKETIKEEKSIENKIVTEIQKIKTVNTTIEKDAETKKETEKDSDKEEKITKLDIQNIKKFLIEEYEVSEKCLEIN